MISRGIPPPSPPSPFSCAAVAFFLESWVFLKALVPHFKGKIIKKKKRGCLFLSDFRDGSIGSFRVGRGSRKWD